MCVCVCVCVRERERERVRERERIFEKRIRFLRFGYYLFIFYGS